MYLENEESTHTAVHTPPCTLSAQQPGTRRLDGEAEVEALSPSPSYHLLPALQKHLVAPPLHPLAEDAEGSAGLRNWGKSRQPVLGVSWSTENPVATQVFTVEAEVSVQKN